MMALQGMPEDWFKHSPFTMQAKRKICGNAVALPTGRMLARAVLKAIREAGHEG
jgi:site-specific DNA-cytosine methylase